MGIFFLTLLCFWGFVYAGIRWLRIVPVHAPFWSISFMGVVLFLAARFNFLKAGAVFLFFSGLGFSFFWIWACWKKRSDNTIRPWLSTAAVFLFLVALSFVLTLDMTFTVIDDYVYWGIMGKYLTMNNHLPVTGCPLDPRILAYTPGTSLVHYFFNVFMDAYHVHMSYFSQSLILISALFVVVTRKHIKRSIVYIATLILLLTIFSGSIFTKLQVDYLLSIFMFSIFWIYITEKNWYLKLLTLSMPICFLFLIKEIGFVLALLVLVIIFFDVLKDKAFQGKNKCLPMAVIFLIGCVVVLFKQLWVSHVTAMGFVEFHNAVNWQSIQTTLHIFSDEHIRKGFIIFVKAFFSGPADRLNIPYLFWYAVIALLCVKGLKTIPEKEKPRGVLFAGIALISLLLYAFLLYCLQIIVFKVGSVSDHTMGFSRYFNILFSPLVFISVLFFFHASVFEFKKVSRKTSISLSVVVLLVLGLSRVEVALNQESLDVDIKKMAIQIETQINNKIDNPIQSIAIITKRMDNLVNLQMLYHLLPHRVDLDIKKIKDQDELVRYIVKYDFLFLYDPDPVMKKWLEPFLGNVILDGKMFFLRVLTSAKEKKKMNCLSLEKVL